MPPSPPTGLPDGQTERRRARSADPLVSLARCFEAARRRAGLHALVLADETGIAIAGAGPSALCDEVAARAAVAPRRAANDTVPCRLDVVARTLEVRRLRIDGIEVLLCGAGAAEKRVEHDALDAAAAGCSRILGKKQRATTRR